MRSSAVPLYVFGVPEAYFCDRLHPEVRAALRRRGARSQRTVMRSRVVDIEHAARTADVYLHIVLPEASWYHAPMLAAHADRYSPGVRLRLEMGRYVLAEDYVRAMHLRGILAASVDRALQSCDALLLPAQPAPAPELGATTVDIDGTREPVRAAMLRLTQLFNITGHPAIALPAGTTGDGWPVGVQLVGPRGEHHSAAAHGRDRGTLQHRRRRIGRRRHGMNIRRIFSRRIARRYWKLGRRQVIDHVRWLRGVWFRWLFDHGLSKCNMAADEGVIRLISRVFHNWERKLAAAAENRVIRPFEWGLEWIEGVDEVASDVAERLAGWASQAVANSEAFFALPSCDDYTLTDDRLRFPSAVTTPHPENNVVHARYFPDRSERGSRRAVLVLPQWNADAEGHVGLCRLLNRFGISALRLSLPYHDARMPPELRARGLHRQLERRPDGAGLPTGGARRTARDRLAGPEGYESIGILGTSLGSCLAMLTAAHEPLIRAAALNHISPYFADVIWRGLSTEHVRASLDGQIQLDTLRAHLDAHLAVSLPRTLRGKASPAGVRPVRSDVSGRRYRRCW